MKSFNFPHLLEFDFKMIILKEIFQIIKHFFYL